MNYEEVYQRNIGLFSREEQERLRNSKVAVAGAGGVGGVQAVTLARFGIGEISLMDPGVFDEPDMNRQYGAMKSTIGKNKAVVTGEILRDVNPFMKVNVYDSVLSEIELKEFVGDSDLVIDAIDYIGFDYKASFAKIAREKGIYNLSAPVPDFGAMLMVFDPDGMTIEEFCGAPMDKEEQKYYRVPHERLFGKNRLPRNLLDFLEQKTDYISTNAGACSLNGGLLATEAALIISGKRKKEDLVVVPNVIYIDLLNRVYEVYNPMEEYFG